MPSRHPDRHSRATEDYLKELLRLELVSGPDTALNTGDLAEGLGVAPSSATAMLRRLSKEGLVEHQPYKGAHLTDRGRTVAALVLRRHRLIETFLAQCLGLDWSEVHAEAEDLEHAVSDKLLDRIDDFLGHPANDPHGDPIPDRAGRMRVRPARPVIACAPGERVTITTVRGHDPEFFAFLTSQGLALETPVEVLPSHPAAGVVLLKPLDREHAEPVALARAAAERVLVADLEGPAPTAQTGPG